MARNSQEDPKKPMTEEERLALCQKMDKELDEFIDSLERKRYTEGWPEDRWEEEMDKHPFFMKSTPEDGISPLAEGLAKLKYDPEENTALELATNYKEDGNFNFKHKNYRMAILGHCIRYQQVILRDQFDKNKCVSDPLDQRRLLWSGENELFMKKNPLPCAKFARSLGIAGGVAYGRVVEPPDWVLDYWHPLEKAQYPEYFKKRECRKCEYIRKWNSGAMY